MKKMTPFKKRTSKKVNVEAFNKKLFIKEFVKVIGNKNLTVEEKTKILTYHCCHNKNSPLKFDKG